MGLLKEYFEKLESTAFGPWLAAFKKLFSKEGLNDELIYYPIKIVEIWV